MGPALKTDEEQPLLRQKCLDKLRALPQEEAERICPKLREYLNRMCNVPGVQRFVPSCDKFLNDLKRKLSSEQQQPVHADDSEHDDSESKPEIKRMVYVVYVLAVLTMLIMTTTSPMLLLYLQHVGFSSASNVQFYVLTTVINSAVPVVGHAGIGAFAARIGAARAIAISCVLVALGLLGMAASPPSKFAFVIAFSVYSLSQSIRVARTVLLTENVPLKLRTGVMSIHALMTPIGALMGPLLWLACEQFRGDVHLFGGLRLNMYTLDYLVAAGIALFMAFVALFFLRTPNLEHPNNFGANSAVSTEQDIAGTSPTSSQDQVVNVVLSDGTSERVNVQRFQRCIFLYFLAVMFCVNVGMGLYTVGFQPILVNKFNATGKDLGVIFEFIAVFALVPPLLVAFLSRYLKDRQIMLIGLCAKIVGIVLFLPIFGPQVHMWQVVVGFILMIKASIFFFTSSMSLFTKLLGGMSNGTMLGVLSSFSALGPAAAQLLFAEKTLSFFGSFKYALFGMPVLLSTALVLWPWYWKRLDPDREFIRVLMREYDSIQTRSHHA